MDKKYLMSTINKTTGSLETYDIRTGELVRSDGMALETGKVYSEALGDAIAGLIGEGRSLISIAKQPGMPSVGVMHRWSMLYPSFKSKVQMARKYRADVYREKAESILENLADKEDVPVAKLKFEGYMRLAEKDNPEMYGNASQAVSGQGMSLKLVVNTGIVRDGSIVEGVEYEKKDDEDIGGLTICGDGRADSGRGGQEDRATDSGDDEECEGSEGGAVVGGSDRVGDTGRPTQEDDEEEAKQVYP